MTVYETPTLELAAPPPRAPVGPPRVLLAEDDPAMRTLLVEALEEEGCEVVEARAGRELRARLLAGTDHDLVVSDIRMPGLSGLEVLEELRGRDWSTPVLLMTAFPSHETEDEAERLGADVIDKPFELEELLDRVRELLRRRRYEG